MHLCEPFAILTKTFSGATSCSFMPDFRYSSLSLSAIFGALLFSSCQPLCLTLSLSVSDFVFGQLSTFSNPGLIYVSRLLQCCWLRSIRFSLSFSVAVASVRWCWIMLIFCAVACVTRTPLASVYPAHTRAHYQSLTHSPPRHSSAFNGWYW